MPEGPKFPKIASRGPPPDRSACTKTGPACTDVCCKEVCKGVEREGGRCREGDAEEVEVVEVVAEEVVVVAIEAVEEVTGELDTSNHATCVKEDK